MSKQYIQFHFGDTRHLTKVNIGDEYPWVENKSVKNGGRPENGDIDGEGYIECSECNKDFFVKAIVRNDILTILSKLGFKKIGPRLGMW